MSKKNRRDNKKPKSGFRGAGDNPNMSRDLTAERQYSSSIGKAERMLENEDFEGALGLLLPMVGRYADRVEVFELLGTAYVGIEFHRGARDAFERVLELSPANRIDPLMRFNLAGTYMATGLPLLGYEQLEKIDWPALSREFGSAAELEQFRHVIDQAVSEMASQNKLSVAEFVRRALPLEQGQVALERGDAEQARQLFQSALQADPQSEAAHNSLALLELVEDNFDEAANHAEAILKINPDNIDALTTLIRVGLGRNDDPMAQQYLARLKAMPVPTEPENRLHLAETYALFDEDQAVYDLIKPTLAELSAQQEDEDEDDGLHDINLQAATLLAAVAAYHLGRRDEAVQIIQAQEFEETDVLFSRTEQALENDEAGPREGDRFFYVPANLKYPATAKTYEALLQSTALELLSAGDETADPTDFLRPLLEKYADTAFDFLLYQIWIADNPILASTLLSEILASGVDGATAFVENVASGKGGSPEQHLLAAGLLIEENIWPKDAPITIWVKGQPRTGNLDDLSAEFLDPA